MRAEVYDIKILGEFGSGAWSWAIAGFDFVAQEKLANPDAKYVLNGSFGGGFNPSMNQAASDLADTGVVVVVAAGNSNADACNFSPASEPSIITVASSTISDVRSSFSNFGDCVDLFGPGSGVLSASNEGDTATVILSGTVSVL